MRRSWRGWRIMLNFNEEPMKEKEQSRTPEVQQSLASRYCELRLLNHDLYIEYLEVDVATEEVAKMIDQSYRFGDQLLRWGAVYRACMDSGIFVPMSVSKFWEMLNNITPDLKVKRATFAKGVIEYDIKEGKHRNGTLKNSDDITFINSKSQLENKLKNLVK